MTSANNMGIEFRDGPDDQRPGLIGGPDVWQVIAVIRGSGETGDPALRHAAEWLNLDPNHIRAAVDYYDGQEQEIDGWIADNDERANAAEAAWRAELGPLD